MAGVEHGFFLFIYFKAFVIIRLRLTSIGNNNTTEGKKETGERK